MKLRTVERINRGVVRLNAAVAYADSALLHRKAIGPALDALDTALTPITFAWMLEVRRDDLAMALAGLRSRLRTQRERDQLLSILDRIPNWKEPGTFSPGPRRRLHDLEHDLKSWRSWSEHPEGTFDPLAADDAMNGGFNGS